jgi:hypothetical protein
MRFDMMRALLLCPLLGALLSVSGCGIKLGDHPADQDSSVQIGGQMGCLSGSADKIGRYFQGVSNEAEIGGLWDCASSELALFSKSTQGQVPGQWSRAELKKFLERYFLEDFRIDDSVVDEFMQLKATLIGGDVDTLKPEELLHAQDLMAELKVVSQTMLPYVPMLSPDKLSALSRAELEQAIAALKRGATSLGQILQENASPYAFSHLDRLLAGIENIMTNGDYKLNVESFRANLPLLQQLKKIIISSGAESDATQMTGADWRDLLSIGADYYSLYLRYHYAFTKNDPSMTDGQGLEDVVELATEGKALLDQLIDRNQGKMVSFQNLDELLDTPKIPGLEGDDPVGIRYFHIGGKLICRQHVKDFLRLAVRRWMSPPPNASRGILPIISQTKPSVKAARAMSLADDTCVYPGPPTTDTDGIHKENLERLWDAVLLFANGQRYLESAFIAENEVVSGTSSGFDKASFLGSLLGGPTLAQLFLPDQLSLNASLVESGNRLRDYLLEPELFPLFAKGELRITYNGYNGDSRESLWGLTLANGIGNLVRFVLSSYIPHQTVGVAGSDADKAQRDIELAYGATRKAIETFYRETTPIGIDVDLYDPKNSNSADKRLLESSLFVYHSVGGDHMTLEEGTDFISTLFSAKMLSAPTYNQIFSDCRADGFKSGPNDVYGKPSIATECFRKKYFGQLIESTWDHMPGLKSYFATVPSRPEKNPKGAGQLDPTTYRETIDCFMEQTARSYEEPNCRDWVDSGDIDEFSALSHYVEALFTRFDRNQDGVLDFDEGMRVFPLVDPLLIEAQEAAQKAYEQDPKNDNPMRSLTSEYRRLGALTYMLKTGNIPSTVDFIWWDVKDVLDFNDWWHGSKHDAWQFFADRGRVLQIIGMISSMESTAIGKPKTNECMPVFDTTACFKW